MLQADSVNHGWNGLFSLFKTRFFHPEKGGEIAFFWSCEAWSQMFWFFFGIRIPQTGPVSIPLSQTFSGRCEERIRRVGPAPRNMPENIFTRESFSSWVKRNTRSIRQKKFLIQPLNYGNGTPSLSSETPQCQKYTKISIKILGEALKFWKIMCILRRDRMATVHSLRPETAILHKI